MPTKSRICPSCGVDKTKELGLEYKQLLKAQAMLDTIKSILEQTPKGKPVSKARLKLTIKHLEFKLGIRKYIK